MRFVKRYLRQLLCCLQILVGTMIFFGFNYVLQNNGLEEDLLLGNSKSVEALMIKESKVRDMICEQLKRGQVSSIPELKVGKGRYDNNRLLRIYDFHYTGDEWESLVSRYDVCFATQTSIEQIYWLPYVLGKWTGPLSVATYVTNHEEWLILNLYMCYLSKCHVGFRNQVAMHFAVPANLSEALRADKTIFNQWSDANMEEVHRKKEMCPEAKEYLQYLLDKFPVKEKSKLKLKEVYPQNHLRNIARKTCGVDWTYSADIDVIPREGMAIMLQDFYQSRKEIPCKKYAYVIPTFELNEKFPFPESKKDLIKLFKTGTARQINGKHYSPGHKSADYKKWTTTNIEEGATKISHGILSKEAALYEQFYISPDNIPPFDEPLESKGVTRNSQLKASLKAGWGFFVLTPVYSIRWTSQTSRTTLSTRKNRAILDASNSTTPTLVFKADFSKPSLGQAFGGARVDFKNVVLWKNGKGFDAYYPVGSHVPAGKIIGGFLLWTNHPINTNTAVFKYDVYFPDDFNFVKGGKLPGLYGGKKFCSGGNLASNCFSTRMMWREGGKGELYLYANREAQDPAICKMPNNTCNPKYGWSLDTGSFTFQRGAWTNIEQTITLNTPGERDGIAAIKVNGQEVIRYSDIVFRTAKYPKMKFEGLALETFFGGNGPQWATPNRQMTKFKEFILESY